MSDTFVLKNVRWTNADPDECGEGDVYIEKGRIQALGSSPDKKAGIDEYDGNGLILLPGVIDDQVHFRDFNQSHKATIASESRAAVVGGVTSYMEMPNTNPPATNLEMLNRKFDTAAQVSPANYSFYVGATNENAEDVLALAEDTRLAGLKIFMGSSTGDMLVDEDPALVRFFKEWPRLIATHCEDEESVRQNLKAAQERYGNDVPIEEHPVIRSTDVCVKSSTKAIELAKKYGTKLHVLHLTTAIEPEFFKPVIGEDRHITSEVCVHHLYFCDQDYERLGSRIKCNPAIKSASDRDALWEALNADWIDVVATDHAPHTLDEKLNGDYTTQPAGLPLIQHPLLLMLSAVHAGRISLSRMVQKMCHGPADLYGVKERGYLREGYWADMVLVDANATTTVRHEDCLYHCEFYH